MASVFAAVSVIVLVAVVWHLMSSETERTSEGVVNRVIRRVPVQAMKIIIVAWQILTQVIREQVSTPITLHSKLEIYGNLCAAVIETLVSCHFRSLS